MPATQDHDDSDGSGTLHRFDAKSFYLTAARTAVGQEKQ